MHLPDLHPLVIECCEVLLDKLLGSFTLLHRAEGVGEVRGHKACLRRRPLGSACTCLEGLHSLISVVEEGDLLLAVLIVISIEEVVHGEALRDDFVGRDGDGHTGIDLVGVGVDPSVKLGEGIHRIEVVCTYEGTDLRPVGTYRPVLLELEIAHVVEDDTHVTDVLLVERAEGFEAFALPRTTIAHDDDVGHTAVLQDDIDHSTVDGEVATLHLLDVVQGQEHLLHVAEVVDLVAVVGVADEDVVLLVLVVEGTLLLVPIRVAEDIDHIRLLADVFVGLSQLEEVRQPKTVAHEVLVEVDER